MFPGVCARSTKQIDFSSFLVWLRTDLASNKRVPSEVQSIGRTMTGGLVGLSHSMATVKSALLAAYDYWTSAHSCSVRRPNGPLCRC